MVIFLTYQMIPSNQKYFSIKNDVCAVYDSFIHSSLGFYEAYEAMKNRTWIGVLTSMDGPSPPGYVNITLSLHY